MASSFQCRNLKMSFTVKTKTPHMKLADSNSELSTRHVSYILRNFELDCVFTIYKHNPHQVHATGIRKKTQLTQILSYVDSRCDMISLKIDNSLFSCKRSNNINLYNTLKRVRECYSDYIPSYSEQIFNALFLKPKEKKVGNPTIILYHNSSYVILGGNCKSKVKRANCFIKELIEK